MTYSKSNTQMASPFLTSTGDREVVNPRLLIKLLMINRRQLTALHTIHVARNLTNHQRVRVMCIARDLHVRKHIKVLTNLHHNQVLVMTAKQRKLNSPRFTTLSTYATDDTTHTPPHQATTTAPPPHGQPRPRPRKSNVLRESDIYIL